MATGKFFADLFGRSPVEPLQRHIATAHQCAVELTTFFQAVFHDDWEQAARAQAKIAELENEADEIQKSISLHLPKSLFLPVPRSDLVALLAKQDQIANRAKDIAGLMLGRKMSIPAQLHEPVFEYLKRSLAASEQAVSAINELDELVETAFGGREIRLVEKMITELNEIEHETDKIEVTIRANLFSIEKNLPPVDVMFLYKIIEWIGDLADCAQKVGSRLQLLIAR